MDKEGRDIVNSVAAAGRLEGKIAQAMDDRVEEQDAGCCASRLFENFRRKGPRIRSGCDHTSNCTFELE
jgi:hypothetical protein